jgi:cytoskeletal protein CcmA (bactofilin family)
MIRSNGSVYLHVLGVSLLVTIIGLAALAGVRVQTRSAQWASDYAEARQAAVAAVELGLLYVQEDPNWRTTYSNGPWLSDQQLGGTTFSLGGIDPNDSDLSDSEDDPLVLTGVGTRGIACHRAQVTLVATIEPLEILSSALHNSGTLYIARNSRVTAVDGPVSTNGTLNNRGEIEGDVEAVATSKVGTVTGTFTTLSASKPMPDTNLIADYISRATVIPYSGAIDGQVLTATLNPWGAADADGLYFIDTGGYDLQIKNTRIHATLVVRTGGANLFVEETVLMENYRSDYPALIVDGTAYIRNTSASTDLSEGTCGVNFNPVGAPYDGQWDGDMLDTYPNEIRGLVHVNGDLILGLTARIEGVVICAGAVDCSETPVIAHDPNLYSSPPHGYTAVAGMKISPGSWKQVVD